MLKKDRKRCYMVRKVSIEAARWSRSGKECQISEREW